MTKKTKKLEQLVRRVRERCNEYLSEDVDANEEHITEDSKRFALLVIELLKHIV